MAKQGLIISVADELTTPHAIGYEQGRALHQDILFCKPRPSGRVRKEKSALQR